VGGRCRAKEQNRENERKKKILPLPNALKQNCQMQQNPVKCPSAVGHRIEL
jgi:hypothetical protein